MQAYSIIEDNGRVLWAVRSIEMNNKLHAEMTILQEALMQINQLNISHVNILTDWKISKNSVVKFKAMP